MRPPLLLQASQSRRLAPHFQILFFPVAIACGYKLFLQPIAVTASRRESALVLRKQFFHFGATPQKPVPQETIRGGNQIVRRHLARCDDGEESNYYPRWQL